MSVDPKYQAALALHRFGLGPRPGSIDAIASDPRGALLAEIERPGAGLIVDANLLPSSKASMAAFNFRQERQARQIALRAAEKERAEGGTMEKAMAAGSADASAAATPNLQPNVQQQIFQSEVRARFSAAHAAEIGFVERLVWFWSNHFCVSANEVPAMAGGYEREAIRAHVLGRFGDMLMAVESHPAMLIYLNNARSIGPKSVAGLIGNAGLNENLAREILELHTLGVRTVYTQDDVTNFAKVLTGWTVLPAPTNPEHGSEFVFNPRMHEPGPQTVVGKIYAQAGMEQGHAVLADIARHPATAAHVSQKLARHFVADDPPPALTQRLIARFLASDGDLKEMAKALVEAPETWDAPMTKLKRPNEWLTATRRAIGGEVEIVRSLRTRALLGEPLWRPPAPQGFPDVQSAWVDGLAQRLDVAERIAERAVTTTDPKALIETVLGPLASAETRQTVARAESRQQALTFALMAPEFHRR
jgi:uncharacterized protein (DUF1800 family)